MNIPAVVLLSASLVTGVVYFEDIEALYQDAHAQVLRIEAQRDEQTLLAARTAFHADRQTGEPTVPRLIELGYLSEDFLDPAGRVREARDLLDLRDLTEASSSP